MAAIARPDDLVLMPSRPGGSPLPPDAAVVASLPVGCSVGVPARPHSTTGLVTGSSTARRAAGGLTHVALRRLVAGDAAAL